VTRFVTVGRFSISLLSRVIRDRFYYTFTLLPTDHTYSYC